MDFTLLKRNHKNCPIMCMLTSPVWLVVDVRWLIGLAPPFIKQNSEDIFKGTLPILLLNAGSSFCTNKSRPRLCLLSADINFI